MARLNLAKHGWQQGMEAAIVAHDTRKQGGAIRMKRQHVHICGSMREGSVKEYSYTEFKCVIIDACEDATIDAHARMIPYRMHII